MSMSPFVGKDMVPCSQVGSLPVDEFVRVSPVNVVSTITDQTVLITVMHADNETWALQPGAELVEIAHRHGILLYTDAS